MYLAEGELDDSRGQVVLVGDVVVGRHGPNTEAVRQPSHAERSLAFPVEQVERGGNDQLTSQVRARHCSAGHFVRWAADEHVAIVRATALDFGNDRGRCLAG